MNACISARLKIPTEQTPTPKGLDLEVQFHKVSSYSLQQLRSQISRCPGPLLLAADRPNPFWRRLFGSFVYFELFSSGVLCHCFQRHEVRLPYEVGQSAPPMGLHGCLVEGLQLFEICVHVYIEVCGYVSTSTSGYT